MIFLGRKKGRYKVVLNVYIEVTCGEVSRSMMALDD